MMVSRESIEAICAALAKGKINTQTQSHRLADNVKRGGSSCSEDKTRDMLLWPADASCL